MEGIVKWHFLSSPLAVSEIRSPQRHFGVCVCVRMYVRTFVVCPSGFVQTINSMSSISKQFGASVVFMSKSDIWNFLSGSKRMRVPSCVFASVLAIILPFGFVRVITSISMDGLHSNLTQLLSLMSRCAILNFRMGRSKVKVTRARRVVPGQPFSFCVVGQRVSCLKKNKVRQKEYKIFIQTDVQLAHRE